MSDETQRLPEGSRPSLDVVVVTYRNRDTVTDLIRSLELLRGWGRVSVLVHDNSGDVELMDSVRAFGLGHDLAVATEVCPGNCGFARACNRMARQGEGDWLLFINPDAVIVDYPDDWIPDRGIWGPELVDARGAKAYLYGTARSLRSEYSRILRRRDTPPAGHGYVSGACLLVDRESFTALGGFDERFFMFYEDIDLGLRASGCGIPVRLNPRWVVSHEGGRSSVGGKDRVFRISARSSVAFHAKHGHSWRAWAHSMSAYFRVRAAVSRLGESDASRTYMAAAEEYRRLARYGPGSENAEEAPQSPT